MLPPTLPLFPLPTIVLFPNVFLPLHIFEPRYRQMVRDALAGERLIGMVLLQPGFEDEYDQTPAVYGVGCAGLITHVDPLPDGRFNLVLRGLQRFRIHTEEAPTPAVLYRQARIESLGEPLEDHDRAALAHERQRLESMLAPLLGSEAAGHQLPRTMADADLINTLSQYLELESLERQALLEQEGPLLRGRTLVELLEMKALATRVAAEPGRWH